MDLTSTYVESSWTMLWVAILDTAVIGESTAELLQQQLARMNDCQVFHGDLTLPNVLIMDPASVLFLDLSSSITFPLPTFERDADWSLRESEKWGQGDERP